MLLFCCRAKTGCKHSKRHEMQSIFDKERQSVDGCRVVADPPSGSCVVSFAGIAISPIARWEVYVTWGCAWIWRIARHGNSIQISTLLTLLDDWSHENLLAEQKLIVDGLRNFILRRDPPNGWIYWLAGRNGQLEAVHDVRRVLLM